MGGNGSAIGDKRHDRAARQVQEDGPCEPAAGGGLVDCFQPLQLPLPLGDGQRFPVGAPDDWALEFLLGLGRDDGVDARDGDEGEKEDDRVEQLGLPQNRLGGTGALLLAAALEEQGHAGRGRVA
jgi:hypothetical protein